MLAFLLLALQVPAGPAQAVVQFQQAIRADPSRESNYTDLGNLLLSTQNFKEAALVLENAKSRFPQSAQVHLSLGVAYYGQRRFPDAVAAFLDAADRDPDAEQPVLFLGRITEHAGDRAEAVKTAFQRFANKHPQNPLGHYLYGKAAADPAALKRSIALNPNIWDSHFELANLYEQAQDYSAAAAEFEKAARLSPKNPGPQYRLMRVYARLNQPAKSQAAKAQFDKLTAQEKAEADKRQAATKHLDLKVRQ
jgi:tetratricopeptide (TPR) repeat protein